MASSIVIPLITLSLHEFKFFVLFQIFTFMLISSRLASGTTSLFLMIILVIREVQADLTCYSSENQRSIDCGDDDAKCITVCSRLITIQGCSTCMSCSVLKSLYPHITDCLECKKDNCNIRACIGGKVKPHFRARQGGRVKDKQPDKEQQYAEEKALADHKDKQNDKGNIRPEAIEDDDDEEQDEDVKTKVIAHSDGKRDDQDLTAIKTGNLRVQEGSKHESRDQQNVKDIVDQSKENKQSTKSDDNSNIEAKKVIKEENIAPRKEKDGKVKDNSHQIANKTKDIEIVKFKNLTRYILVWPDSVDYDAVSGKHITKKTPKNSTPENTPPTPQNDVVAIQAAVKTTQLTSHHQYDVTSHPKTNVKDDDTFSNLHPKLTHTTFTDEVEGEENGTTPQDTVKTTTSKLPDDEEEEEEEEKEKDDKDKDAAVLDKFKTSRLNALEKILLGLLLTLLSLILCCFCCHQYICRPWCCPCAKDSCNVVHNEKLEITIHTGPKSKSKQRHSSPCFGQFQSNEWYDDSDEIITVTKQNNSARDDLETDNIERCNRSIRKHKTRSRDTGTRTVCSDIKMDNTDHQFNRSKMEHIQADKKETVVNVDCPPSDKQKDCQENKSYNSANVTTDQDHKPRWFQKRSNTDTEFDRTHLGWAKLKLPWIGCKPSKSDTEVGQRQRECSKTFEQDEEEKGERKKWVHTSQDEQGPQESRRCPPENKLVRSRVIPIGQDYKRHWNNAICQNRSSLNRMFEKINRSTNKLVMIPGLIMQYAQDSVLHLLCGHPLVSDITGADESQIEPSCGNHNKEPGPSNQYAQEQSKAGPSNRYATSYKNDGKCRSNSSNHYAHTEKRAKSRNGPSHPSTQKRARSRNEPSHPSTQKRARSRSWSYGPPHPSTQKRAKSRTCSYEPSHPSNKSRTCSHPSNKSSVSFCDQYAQLLKADKNQYAQLLKADKKIPPTVLGSEKSAVLAPTCVNDTAHASNSQGSFLMNSALRPDSEKNARCWYNFRTRFEG